MHSTVANPRAFLPWLQLSSLKVVPCRRTESSLIVAGDRGGGQAREPGLPHRAGTCGDYQRGRLPRRPGRGGGERRLCDGVVRAVGAVLVRAGDGGPLPRREAGGSSNSTYPCLHLANAQANIAELH